MPALSDADALYALLYPKIGQESTLSVMRTVSVAGVRLFTDEEVKDVNRRYLAEYRAKRRKGS